MEIYKKSPKTILKANTRKNHARSSKNFGGICQNWCYRKILKKARMRLKDSRCSKKLWGSSLSDQPEKAEQLHHEGELQAPHSPKPKSSSSKKFMASKTRYQQRIFPSGRSSPISTLSRVQLERYLLEVPGNVFRVDYGPRQLDR